MPFALLGSIASGLINNALGEMSADRQRQFQSDMMDKQNSYNSPINQLLMKKAAGVNPYAGTGFIPSGSAGQGAQAQVFPITDPLLSLKTLSEVENINASTGRTETETEVFLRQLSMLDVAYERELMSLEEYRRRQELLFEEWALANPFTVQRENTESQTEKNKADARLSDQLKDESVVRQSNMGFENQLLQKQIAWYDKDHQAAIDHTRASIALMDAQTQNYVAQTDNINLLKERVEFVNSCNNWLGFDISALPDASKTEVLSIYRKVLIKEISPVAGMRDIQTILSAAGKHERAILESASGSGQIAALWGLGSISGSGSSTTNVNQ